MTVVHIATRDGHTSGYVTDLGEPLTFTHTSESAVETFVLPRYGVWKRTTNKWSVVHTTMDLNDAIRVADQ